MRYAISLFGSVALKAEARRFVAGGVPFSVVGLADPETGSLSIIPPMTAHSPFRNPYLLHPHIQLR